MFKNILVKYGVLIFLLICTNLTFSQSFFQLKDLQAENTFISYGEVTNVGLGPGVSFFDYNQDGRDDITLPASGNKDFQFLKNINGNFEIQNLPISSNGLQARQASWIDFDNDGDYDFFATSDQGRCWLYRNDGNEIFTDIIGTTGITYEGLEFWGASWGDYDNDGFLDLFLSIRDPLQNNNNLLFHNQGNGTFIDVTESAGLHANGLITFCSSFFDYDKDGFQDIYIANDKEVTPNILYRNMGDGTFKDVSVEAGVGLHMNAMSTTIGDYNNDGWLDIYVTNFYPSFTNESTAGNAFLINNGDGTFDNIAFENGTRFDSIGWGAIFFDADMDADIDLYVSGNLDGSDGRLSSAYYENDSNGVYRIPDNSGFINDTSPSYGNALGDFQNDGKPDIVVINTNNKEIQLWENKTSNENNWLKIKLEGTISNKMGIGSFIEVGVQGKKLYNYTLCGEGYISQNSGVEFFGLGAIENVDYIEVRWLSGLVDRLENISVNQEIKIIEGSAVSDTEDETTEESDNDEDDESEASDMDEEEETSEGSDNDEAEESELTKENDNLYMYPNPSSGLFKVNITIPNNYFEVYNSIGQFVKGVHSDDRSIDLSDIGNGIFYIKTVRDKKTNLFKVVILD